MTPPPQKNKENSLPISKAFQKMQDDFNKSLKSMTFLYEAQMNDILQNFANKELQILSLGKKIKECQEIIAGLEERLNNAKT